MDPWVWKLRDNSLFRAIKILYSTRTTGAFSDAIVIKKRKIFYGQKPPSIEFTAIECGFNYQLLAVIHWSSPIGSSYSCSPPQPATDNDVRDGRSNWLVAPSTLHRAVPPEFHVLHTAMRAGLQITRLTALRWAAKVRPSGCQTNALPVRPLRVCVLSITIKSSPLDYLSRLL